MADGKLDISNIKGCRESFVTENIDGNLVVAGSDKRGTIYGIYDISEKASANVKTKGRLSRCGIRSFAV